MFRCCMHMNISWRCDLSNFIKIFLLIVSFSNFVMNWIDSYSQFPSASLIIKMAAGKSFKQLYSFCRGLFRMVYHTMVFMTQRTFFISIGIIKLLPIGNRCSIQSFINLFILYAKDSSYDSGNGLNRSINEIFIWQSLME